MSEMQVECWCYGVRETVKVKGVIVGRRQADLLQVVDCERKDCFKRGRADCLIGKLRESRWP